MAAHQRDEGGAEVWAYEYFGGAGVGPEEHQSPHQIRPRRGERDGNRSGLGHGEQVDRRSSVGRDGGQLGHARVQPEVVDRTGGASGPVAVVYDQRVGSDESLKDRGARIAASGDDVDVRYRAGQRDQRLSTPDGGDGDPVVADGDVTDAHRSQRGRRRNIVAEYAQLQFLHGSRRLEPELVGEPAGVAFG